MTSQIHTAEHNLKQIDGHSIVASKKKRQMSARHSTSDTPSDEQYTFPSTYEAFCKQLSDACKEGDEDSKAAISQLAPYMAAALKEVQEWENPRLALSQPPSGLKLVTALNQTITPWTEEDLQDAMDSILGPAPEIPLPSRDEHTLTNADIEQAYANYVTDGLVTLDEDPSTNSVNTLLKGIQPYREKPSKDRSKRFAAGDLPFDAKIPESHDVQIYQYWTVLPTTKFVRSAKVFLLGQIIYLSESTSTCKPVRSSIKTNPNLSAILNVYEYQADLSIYTPAGKSGLIKTTDNLQINVSQLITTTMEGVQLDHRAVPSLIEYHPFHSDLDLHIQLSDAADPQNDANIDPVNGDEGESDTDPYIVENIVDKRFNPHKSQYEYLIKWLGYDAKENTWELPNNIPDSKLQQYEQRLLNKDTEIEPRKRGLRPRSSLKSTLKSDFIVNM